LDLRTVAEEEEQILLEAVRNALQNAEFGMRNSE
jgi:hypothetical protein